MQHLKEVVSSPVFSIPLSISGVLQSFISWTTPLIQYLILVLSLVVIALSVCIKWKQFKKL